MTWQNFGRKSAMQLIDALETIGYPASQNTKMTDPGCQIFLTIGKAILRNYFDYYTKNSMDDAEYIPTVKVIIEGITKEMKSSGMGEPNCNELSEKLKTFNRQMYQNIWIDHAKEDEDTLRALLIRTIGPRGMNTKKKGERRCGMSNPGGMR